MHQLHTTLMCKRPTTDTADGNSSGYQPLLPLRLLLPPRAPAVLQEEVPRLLRPPDPLLLMETMTTSSLMTLGQPSPPRPLPPLPRHYFHPSFQNPWDSTPGQSSAALVWIACVEARHSIEQEQSTLMRTGK